MAMPSFSNNPPGSPVTFVPLSSASLPETPWTLVIPAVTVGNIGQLAVDLLLSSTKAAHLGRLHAPCILPFACPSPSHPVHLSPFITPIELYSLPSSSRSLVLLQQRAPVAPGRTAEHASALISWARSAGCVEVVVLASANAAGRRDPQLRAAVHGGLSSRIRFAATSAAVEQGRLGARAEGVMKWPLVEGMEEARGWAMDKEARDAVEEDRVQGTGKVPAFLPTTRKGAFVREVLEECEGSSIPLTCLLMFVHEGDNSTDACVMASASAMLLELEVEGEDAAETGEPQVEGFSGGSAAVEGVGAEIMSGGFGVAEGGVDPLMKYMPLWKIPNVWQQTVAPPIGLY